MTRLARIAGATALASALAASLGAQSVRGVVVNAGGIPVPGVVVQLIDSAAAVAGHTLSNEKGEYLVIARHPGTFTLRTLRIGWKPTTVDAIRLAVGQEFYQRIELSGIVVHLDTVRVGSSNVCGLKGSTAASTFAVYEQVRTALTATQITAGTGGLAATTLRFDRRMEGTGSRQIEGQTQVSSRTVSQPWSTLAPAVLHTIGYVLTDSTGITYYAPGLDMLVADIFVDDHCFRIVSGKDRTRIGLAFEPTTERKQVVEIKGTLWLDRTTSELRELEYGYTNLPDEQAQAAGGTIVFARMKDGGWVIADWHINMPVMHQVQLPRLRGRQGGTRLEVAEIRIAGGALALAMRGADTLWARQPVLIVGNVRDSVTGNPIRGARASIAGTAVADSSDAEGNFRLNVLPGEYMLEVRTASLDSIGARHQLPLTITLADTGVALRVPSAALLANTICTNSRGRGSAVGNGLVIGTVRAADGGVMGLAATITAEWTTAADRQGRWVEVRADPRGGFRLCNMPVGVPILVRAQTDSASASPVGIRIAPGGRFARADLRLDRSAAGSATFMGTVVDSGGQPLPRAEVVFPELEKTVLSNDRGAFRVHDIPAGEQHVVVRKIGYGPLDAKLDFGANQSMDRRVVLTKVTELAAVSVTAEAGYLSSFEDNRKVGLGTFFTEADIAKRISSPLAEVIATAPGAFAARSHGNAAWITSKRAPPVVSSNGHPPPSIYFPDAAEKSQGMPAACYPKVYLDGMLMNPGFPNPPFDMNSIPTNQVVGVEFYAGAADIPAKYATLNSACGVVVVWTKR